MTSFLVLFISLILAGSASAETVYSGTTYSTTYFENVEVVGFEFTNFTGSITQQKRIWPLPPNYINDDNSWQWCREQFDGGSYLQRGAHQSYVFIDKTHNTYKSVSRNYNKYDFYTVYGGCNNIYPYDPEENYPYIHNDSVEISDGNATPSTQTVDAFILGAGRLPYKLTEYTFYYPDGCYWQYGRACSSYESGSFYEKTGYFEFLPLSVAPDKDIEIDVVINSAIYIPMSDVFYPESFVLRVENKGTVTYHPFTEYIPQNFYKYTTTRQSYALGIYKTKLKFKWQGEKIRLTIATAPDSRYSLTNTAVVTFHLDQFKVKPMSAFPVWDKPPYVAKQSILDTLKSEFSATVSEYLGLMFDKIRSTEGFNVPPGASVVTWSYNGEENSFDFAQYEDFFVVVNVVVYLVSGAYSIKLITKSWGS